MKLTTTELILVAIFLSVINPGATEDEADCVRWQNSTEINSTEIDSMEINATEMNATESNPTESSPATPSSSTNPSKPHHRSSPTLAPLPEATDTFDSIRDEKKLFVDKSRFIRLFMKKGGLYVLTRPKRFGKSVFLQMVRRFLEGEVKFFDNTEIAKRGNGIKENEGWNRYPVIYIDFEDIPVTGTATEFRREIEMELKMIAQSYKAPNRNHLTIGRLIKDLKDAYEEKPVSILIDNYDLPLMNELSTKKRKEITAILAEFYGQIRANVDNVRLGLVVGLSVLNIIGNANARFTDLSNDERFLSAMGFNSEEFESTLKPYAEKFVHPKDKKFAEKYKRIRNDFRIWYGKHRFSHRDNRTQLLNPASICACLKNREFRDYMGNSLIIPEIRALFKKDNKKLEDFEHYAMKRELVQKSNFEPGKIPLPLFLLCTGFLTVVDYNRGSDTIYLNYPNREIKQVLSSRLPEELIGKDDKGKTRLKNALEQNAMEKLVYLLNEFNFRDEDLSHSLRTEDAEFPYTKRIYKSLKSAEVDCEEGLAIYSMDARDRGDLDLIVKTDKLEYFIEVKYDHDAVKAVLQLICYIIKHESAFLERINLEKRIFLVGMNVQPSKTATNETTIAINQWALLPYRNKTIRIDEFRASSNLEEDFIRDLKHRLTQKSSPGCTGIDYVNSDKIAWQTTESV